MINLSKASVGFYGDFLEYRRMNQRRLFVGDDFTEEDILKIGRELEGFNKSNTYKIVEYNSRKLVVHIGTFKGVSLPLNKDGKKVMVDNLKDLIDIPEKTSF